MKTRLTLLVEEKIVAKAKSLAKSQRISVSELFSRTIEAMEDDDLKIRFAAARMLEKLKTDPPIPELELSDKELINEHRKKKFGL